MNTTIAGQPPLWQGQLRTGLTAHVGFKIVGLTVFLTVFFAAYFSLLKSPLFAVTVMPVTALDRLVPFAPASLWLYVSLWPYVSLAPCMLDSRREIVSYFIAAAAISVAGMAVFLLWPTAVPDAHLDWSLYPQFAPLKSVDSAGNALPSLHAAFAVFTAAWLQRILRRSDAPASLGWLNWCWCIGILYSTLATRQHVAVDLFGGTALGAAGAALHLRLSPIGANRTAADSR